MKISLPIAALAAALLAPCVPAIAAPASPTTPVQAPHLIPILANAKSFSVTETISHVDAPNHLVPFGIKQVRYEQGDKYYVDVQVKGKGHTEHVIAVSDGTHRYEYFPSQAKYRAILASANPIAFGQLHLETMPSK